MWPVTFERKKTRMAERSPYYVITSQILENNICTKMKKKMQNELLKQQKKKTRKIHRAEKENQPAKRIQQQVARSIFPVLNKNKKTTNCHYPIF